MAMAARGKWQWQQWEVIVTIGGDSGNSSNGRCVAMGGDSGNGSNGR